MSKYSINDTTLDNIATPIMSMRGLTGGLTPEEMATNANAVVTNITNALSAIAGKGVDVTGKDSDDLAALITSISSGGKVVSGEFSLKARNQTYTITHDLGEVPNIAMSIAERDGNFVTSFMHGNGVSIYWYYNTSRYEKEFAEVTRDLTDSTNTVGISSATASTVLYDASYTFSAAYTVHYILGVI